MQARNAVRRQRSPLLRFLVSRHFPAKRRRHRRYQRLHEKSAIGRRDVGAQALQFQFVGNHRADRGDRGALQSLAQPRFASMLLRDLHEAADLTRTRQSDRIDAAVGHLVDGGDDIGVGGLCVIDIGQDSIEHAPCAAMAPVSALWSLSG